MRSEIDLTLGLFKNNNTAPLKQKERFDETTIAVEHNYGKPIKNEGKMPRRNDKCFCGSGKKFKSCHMKESNLT